MYATLDRTKEHFIILLHCNTLTFEDDKITKFQKNDSKLCHVRDICSHDIKCLLQVINDER